MFTFKIGADPEFLLYHGNRMAPARQVMNAAFAKLKEPLTLENDGYKVARAGNVGWDGHDATGEMRPLPSTNPKEVAQHVGDLVKAAHAAMPYLTMTSLSIGNPIGGHVHLEVPVGHELLDASEMRTKSIFKLLGTFLAPIVASEHKLSTAIRFGGGSYGRLDDVRVQNPRSGVTTYEVRGLTAEWACRPEIAEATFAYLGVVWNEILTKETAPLLRHPTIARNNAQLQSIQQLLITEYTPILDGLVDNLYKYVQTFSAYPENKAAVDLIFDTAKCYRMKEEVGWNHFRGWKVSEDNTATANVTKRIFLSDKQAVAAMKKMDLDVSQTTPQGILYNDDFNMGKLMSTLAERLTTFNISLDREYYFFGLRKGANDFLIVKRNNARDGGDALYYKVPTNVKKADLADLTTRMHERYTQRSRSTGLSIDPKTGKNINAKKKEIVYVGIPYELRAEGDVKTFLSTIWDVEHNTIDARNFDAIQEPVLKKGEEETIDTGIPTDIAARLETNERNISMPSILQGITEN